MNSSVRWLVQLKGESGTLERLAQLVRTPYLAVEQIDGRHYVSSSEFAGITDPGQVEQQATYLLEAANGALRVHDPSYLPFVDIVCAVQQTPGKPLPIVVQPEPVQVSISVLPPTVTGATPVKPTIQDRIGDRIALAAKEPDVERAFRYLESPRLDFSDLYKVGEIIKRRAGGTKAAVGGRRWATTAEFQRFMRTANHYRHAAGGPHCLPPKPMTRMEARRFACRLVDQWLRDDFGK